MSRSNPISLVLRIAVCYWSWALEEAQGGKVYVALLIYELYTYSGSV